MAIGIFGMGMGGTAISALTTVKLTAHLGIHAPFLLVAGVLTVLGVAAAAILRDAPGRLVPSQPALSRLWGQALQLAVDRQPDVGEHPEGHVVREQPLQVAQHAAADG